MTEPKITRAYIRHYADNRQTKAYVEWDDGSRTEGDVLPMGRGRVLVLGQHMKALFTRAQREGLTITYETWG